MNILAGTLLIILELIFSGLSKCKVCQTQVCQKFSDELKVSLNRTVDPCDDFSSFVCGNYDKLHSIPPGENSFNSMQEIASQITDELKNLLDRQSSFNTSSAKSKAKIFYQSCVNMNERNKISRNVLLQLVKNFTKESSYEANLKNLLASGLSSRLIGIGKMQNPQNPEYNILAIAKPELIISEVNLQSPDSEISKKQFFFYKNMMNSVLDELSIWKQERNFIDEIFVLHTKLAKILPSVADQNDPLKYTNVIKISQLQSKCREIDWKNLINGVLKGANHTFNDSVNINVFSLSYIDGLCSILKEYKSNSTKKRVMDLDLQWAVLSSVVSLGSEKLVNISDELSANLYGITGKKELSKICLDSTSSTLSDIMGHMYITNYFQASKKKDIQLMIDGIKKTLKSVLEKITWMDSQTKTEALKKLASLKYKIGFPDRMLSEHQLNIDFKNVTMSPNDFMKNVIDYTAFSFIKELKTINEKTPDDEWLMPVHQVNAYYNPMSNEIGFPAAILRNPFYDIDLPISINYGAIGTVIGHEILHGFDNGGSRYDDKGHLREWWTKSSRDEYDTKTKCILQQYKEYSIYNQSLPAEQTLGEDIADNAGMRMAYAASFSPEERREQLTLPGHNFTSEQLFFVSNAKIWCSLFTQDALLEIMKNDEHTIWKYRINGAVSNMPEFSKAFNCDRSKKMNRPKKCVVW